MLRRQPLLLCGSAKSSSTYHPSASKHTSDPATTHPTVPADRTSFPRSPAHHTHPFSSNRRYRLLPSRQPSRQLPIPAYRLLRAHHPLGGALLHRLPVLCICPVRAHASQLGLLRPGVRSAGLLHSCLHLFVRSYRPPTRYFSPRHLTHSWRNHHSLHPAAAL